MVDYTRLQGIADRLIANADDSGVNRSVYTPAIDGGGYDNNGNPLPAQPRVDIFGSASPLFSYKQDEIDGDVVRSTDAYILFSPDDKDEVIKIGMLYDVNGKTYRVQDLQGITSNGGVKVYQKLQLRA
jgi:hypothetical protein